LTSAFQSHASDIHFYPFANKTDVYFRIQGTRILHQTIPTTQYELLLTYYKFSSGMDIGEIRKPQNGTITHHAGTGQYALRLSTLPLNHVETLAVPILLQKEKIPIDQLFLFPNQLAKMKNWTTNRAGSILLTGPTRSGKTTTLYDLLQATLQEKSYQTTTVADPVEKDIHDS